MRGVCCDEKGEVEALNHTPPGQKVARGGLLNAYEKEV